MAIPFSFLNSQVQAPTGIFTAVGTNVCCFSEDDGLTWTSGTMPTGDWKGVATNGLGLWVAVGHNGITAVSNDGKTFTSSTTIGTLEFNDISYSQNLNLFATVARLGTTNQVRTSPDGVTWTTRNIGTNQGWTSITNDSNLFVTVNSIGGSLLRYATSTDGITWTRNTNLGNAGFSVRFLKDRFLALHANTARYSLDGFVWTPIATLVGSNLCPVYLSSIDTWGFISSNGTSYYSSTDGISFTRTVQAGLVNVQKAANSLTTAVAVKSSGNDFFVTTTLSGAAWSTVSVPAGAYFGICFI